MSALDIIQKCLEPGDEVVIDYHQLSSPGKESFTVEVRRPGKTWWTKHCVSGPVLSSVIDQLAHEMSGGLPNAATD